MRRLCLAALLLALPCIALPVATESFDHGYADYAQVLARHVQRSGAVIAFLDYDWSLNETKHDEARCCARIAAS